MKRASKGKQGSGHYRRAPEEKNQVHYEKDKLQREGVLEKSLGDFNTHTWG
jgi:hypothetical protein